MKSVFFSQKSVKSWNFRALLDKKNWIKAKNFLTDWSDQNLWIGKKVEGSYTIEGTQNPSVPLESWYMNKVLTKIFWLVEYEEK